MDYIQICIDTTQSGLEIVCGALEAVGIEQTEIIEDKASVERFLAEVAAYWDYVDADAVLRGARKPCVRAYVSDNASGRALRDAARARIDWLRGQALGVDMGGLTFSEQIVRQEDWANNWKQYYKPMRIGARLVVKPAWEALPEEMEGGVVLNINPGMVFGTGQHETTALCLEALQQVVQPGDRVLDAGCGSGILSIAALLLGAGEAFGVDIDPNAVDIAYENAAMNGIGRDRYRVLAGNIVQDVNIQRQVGAGFDVVVANIVADVVINLTPYAARVLRSGGTFIASGIICERRADVCAQMVRAGLRVVEEREKNGWMAIRAKACGQ
nr:50S ribosomal protein L11 methyltransferase [Maliibacterium massiliense]